MPSCFAYTPAKPAKNGQEETALLLNFGGSCFVCCCVYFNRYARSVKVTVRVLPGQLPVSPENAGAGTSIKPLYVVVLLFQTAIRCVFISGVQNRAENLITEVMVPRCVHGTMRSAAECTTFVLPIARRCHRAGVPPGPFRATEPWIQAALRWLWRVLAALRAASLKPLRPLVRTALRAACWRELRPRLRAARRA